MAKFDLDAVLGGSPFDSALKAEGVSGQVADIARSIYQQESGSGKNTRTSNAGARGGMQIIPATFDRMADKGWAIDNPEHNARAGVRYIKTLYEKAGGDPALTAAGYYGGEGAISKARRGVAVSDPRNPKAPNTLQYGQQVAARLPTQPTAQPKAQRFDLDAALSQTQSLAGKADQIPPAMPGQNKPGKNPAKEAPGLIDRAIGVLEAPLAIGTGVFGGTVGAVGGFFNGLQGSNYGTQKGVNDAADYARRVSNRLTYQPRTQTGQDIVQGFGDAVNDSGIMGVPLPQLNQLAVTAGQVKNATPMLARQGSQAVTNAASAGKNSLARIVPAKKPAMVGMGAANTDIETLRINRAADLPVPIRLTKGQASRTFEQQKFERETAKLPEGEPLRQRFAEQNDQVLQNFDAFFDMTGGQSSNLRDVGKLVTTAVYEKRKRAKAETTAAYNRARDAGHMNEPVPVASILKYVEDNRPAALNAPVISTVELAIKKLDPGNTGFVSINDLEELRKMTGRVSQPGTPNAVFGGELKTLIDAATDGKGGDLYKSARRKHADYAAEFKNTGVTSKLMSLKPGTKDRSVALEDVFSHTILKGSLDDVRAIRRTLQTGGDNGLQAWRELQGQTVQHIKDTITSNSARDVYGNAIVSPDKLNKLVANLDADGKLDYIFGKKGAQQIRDVNDMAKDIYTSPPGSVNTSNTASVLIGLLDTAVSGFAGAPLPIGTALNFGVKRIKSKRLTNQVNASLLNELTDPKGNATANKLKLKNSATRNY